MPWITVTSDDGQVTWRERVAQPDFESRQFGRQLAERLHWAVGDADEAPHRPLPLVSPSAVRSSERLALPV